jgi:hypothetical protein
LFQRERFEYLQEDFGSGNALSFSILRVLWLSMAPIVRNW